MSRFGRFRLLISHLAAAPSFEAALDEKRQDKRLRAVMASQQTQQKQQQKQQKQM